MLNHQGTKRIETDSLILRRYKIEDSSNMYDNWASDKEVTKFLTWDIHTDVEFSKRLINLWISEYLNLSTYHWVIELKDNNEAIGDISVFNLKDSHSSCEIGYVLSKKYWNKGIMSEAFTAVIDYMFEEVNLNRVVAMHNVENTASGKVMIKSNMTFEGTLRQANKLKNSNEYYDLDVYSILKSEWSNVRVQQL